MVHTRGQGARPEGFTEWIPQKQPVAAKRKREEDDLAAENTSKRPRRPVTPNQPKFLFSTTRNRSLLTSAPPKFASQRESPYYNRILKPTSREKREEKSPVPQERACTPQTPIPAQSEKGFLGSVRRIFGYLTGAQGATERVEQPQQSSPSESTDTTTNQERETVEPDSPTPQTTQSEHPTPDPEILDSGIYTREFFKRRRTRNTIAGREQLAAMRAAAEGSAEFNLAATPESHKRKLTSVDGEIPGPKRGGFGIDDSYLDVDNEVEGIEESQLPNARLSTPATRPAPQTPLRSALRQNGGHLGSVGRSTKSVRINPNTSVRNIYGQFHSGEYHGSMFSDPSDASDSSISAINVLDVHSPTMVQQNTRYNVNPGFRLDTSVVDPNDHDWRPSLANPLPGHFRVPDLDEDDDEEGITTTTEVEMVQEPIPPQPGTPRMSHAELPQRSPPTELSTFTGHTNNILNDSTTEFKLNKARSDAQKYKPAKSSRLSLSEQARSRSSSPPSSDADFTAPNLEMGTPSPVKPRNEPAPDTPGPEIASTSPRQTGLEELDNAIVGEDGMTDYQREHQYDDWARSVFAEIVPQTYEEAGVASNYIADLVRRNWTERDEREAVEFWTREFAQGLQAAKEAAAQGRELVWVTSPSQMAEGSEEEL
ncbi:uncharacterized protein Z518_09173 [Rhinocladiella mackenziei CBS 650.93]|uniref:Uncharacterized protein n=1 Tax=Rhinocladiella mackenziei CBS 650.93 TaxID=1442369 RepID=A0A0D2FHI4_9EURO|nr:uncharacterized protein Z518_09173 [Rhinocladiella mackenziei CBS 650.93]KIX01447.1 hypothetical protein Z518_09173 [Rhinocladiella mackenziei CBS 650.93]